MCARVIVKLSIGGEFTIDLLYKNEKQVRVKQSKVRRDCVSENVTIFWRVKMLIFYVAYKINQNNDKRDN